MSLLLELDNLLDDFLFDDINLLFLGELGLPLHVVQLHFILVNVNY